VRTDRIVDIPAPCEPPSAAEIYQRGCEEWKAGELDAAIQSFERFLTESDAASSRGPQWRVAARYSIAGILDQQGRARRAIAAYEDAFAAFGALHELDVDPWLTESVAGVRARYEWLLAKRRRDTKDWLIAAGLYGLLAVLLWLVGKSPRRQFRRQ
jgi:tetratricopeptide (TPR) repeat protein